MKLQDALFNWLQMKIVAAARPDDWAAGETLAFFEEILHEDHELDELDMKAADEETIEVNYRDKAGSMQTMRFPREMAEKLLTDIQAEPKYNQ
ncbi:hypothetical protein DUZ99_05240 [Xylanibacillus composti]|uniref:Uncharacterized protein n=1 Tax=Xylanibacillus composti TaxID=1572762 RepID=A0A8J4M1L9_9BACL|nr:hypothetical protein [Xylanibacillus composti]MDT9724392.1 hypothetical protein [Xylanibacillus composti]GIQ67987.1 hypothetical protein XYCOK13_08110 [Xylanibacillus composti]